MIYAIENGQKIPLGTQFSNDWQIEYDRDLSSQLSGKSEWTAPEDCWFQFHSIWIRQGDSYTNDNAYLSGVQITLNDVNVANMDKSNITNGTTGAVYMITSQLLMKKGDTVKFYSTASTGSQPAFNTTTTHVFPIHRILSKDEGPVEVTLTVSHDNPDLFTTTSRSPTVTLYPIGNDVYIFATPVGGINFSTVSTGGTGNTTFSFSISGYDMLDMKMDYWQNATGVPAVSGTTSANINLDKYIAVVQGIQKNGQFVFIRGQGIVRRKQS